MCAVVEKITLLPDIAQVAGSFIGFPDLVYLIENVEMQAFEKDIPQYHIYLSSQFRNPICYRHLSPNVIYLSPGNMVFYPPQMFYQLSHELCHLLIGYGTLSEYMWIEETICALASFVFPVNSDIKDRFICDIDEYIQQEEANFIKFDTRELFDYNSSISQYLRSHSTDRGMNTYVASLLKPLVFNNPNFWMFFSYLPSVPSGLDMEGVINDLEKKSLSSESIQLRACAREIKSGILSALKPVNNAIRDL